MTFRYDEDPTKFRYDENPMKYRYDEDPMKYRYDENPLNPLDPLAPPIIEERSKPLEHNEHKEIPIEGLRHFDFSKSDISFLCQVELLTILSNYHYPDGSVETLEKAREYLEWMIEIAKKGEKENDRG